MSALEGLTDADSPIIQIVAICADPADSPHAEQLRRLCEECSTNHEVSLIWHDPLVETPLAVQPEADGADRPLRHLAAVVVDEVTDEASATPSFSTRSIAG